MNKELGRKGEDLAGNYLLKKGYKIRARNFQRRSGEIDIVASKEKFLVFIEVKTRRQKKYGTGMESITLEKQRKILETSLFYMVENEELDLQPRYDVISIFIMDGNPRISHIENAFTF